MHGYRFSNAFYRLIYRLGYIRLQLIKNNTITKVQDKELNISGRAVNVALMIINIIIYNLNYKLIRRHTRASVTEPLKLFEH